MQAVARYIVDCGMGKSATMVRINMIVLGREGKRGQVYVQCSTRSKMIQFEIVKISISQVIHGFYFFHGCHRLESRIGV